MEWVSGDCERDVSGWMGKSEMGGDGETGGGGCNQSLVFCFSNPFSLSPFLLCLSVFTFTFFFLLLSLFSFSPFYFSFAVYYC